MTSPFKQRLILFCSGAGLTLLMAGLVPFVFNAAPIQAQDEPATPEAVPPTPFIDTEPVITGKPTGENGYCAVCHSQPWRSVTLPYGTVLNLYVTPDMIASSVHGTSSPAGALGCLDCHGENAFPHNQPSPSDGRTYTLNAVAMCTKCHTQEAADLENGLHEVAIRDGNRNAAVCIDCHGAHDIQVARNQPNLVAGVCGECHTETLAEWQSSLHLTIGPLGCATCHSPHSQRMRVEGDGDLTCQNCHKHTNDLYVHRTHLTPESEVSCLNCHMYRETTDGESGLASHTMVMDTQPCTTCHQELVDSGRWQQLTGVNTRLAAERDALQARLNELEAQQSASVGPEHGELVPVLQGLLLGLGLGLTVAVVFFSRRQTA